MTINLELTNIQLSKQLKNIGAPQQKTLYFWQYTAGTTDDGVHYEGYKLVYRISAILDEKDIAAYTLRELGELIMLANAQPMFTYNSDMKLWFAQFLTGESFQADTEIESRANVVIYMLENQMIEKN